MDLLRSEAQAEFCKMAFEPLDQPFEVAQIISQRFTEVDDDLVLESKRLSATELNFFATETGSSADTDISPSLKLVRFPYMVGQKLFVRWEVFHHVFRSFMLEPLMLRMALRNSASFYELGQCVSSNGHEVLRYYLDMRAYIILWSYNTGTAATRAIVLTRTSKGSKRAYSNFYAKLEIYRSLVYHPTFLPFIAVMNVLIYVDEFLKEEVKELGNAERETGFSYFYRHVPTPDYTAEQELLVFSNMSRVASGTLVGIADMTGHLQTAQVVLDYILNDAVQWNRDICQNTKFQIEKCEKSIIEVSVFLRSQLDSTFRYMEFIKERARNQLTVLFNLLTRGDAQTNINLAKATRQDSSSMKTIAVMTMAFLPGTFFAALFAIPSLQWGNSRVIQDSFWIYWAFTLPSTVLVFVVWLSFTNWTALKNMIRKRAHSVTKYTI